MICCAPVRATVYTDLLGYLPVNAINAASYGSWILPCELRITACRMSANSGRNPLIPEFLTYEGTPLSSSKEGDTGESIPRNPRRNKMLCTVHLTASSESATFWLYWSLGHLATSAGLTMFPCAMLYATACIAADVVCWSHSPLGIIPQIR